MAPIGIYMAIDSVLGFITSSGLSRARGFLRMRVKANASVA